MVGDLLSIIIMLLITLIGIFKDYFFKEQTPRWVVLLLIVASVSVAAFQVSSLFDKQRKEQYALYAGRIRGTETLEYPAIKLGTAILQWKGKEGEPIIRIGDDPIIIWLENGKPMISAIIRNEEGSIIAKIDGNQWNINPNLMFDRNFDNKAVEVIDEEGKVVLQAILEEDGIRFAGIFYRDDGWKFAIGENIWEMRPPENELETSFEPIFQYPSQLHPGERIP